MWSIQIDLWKVHHMFSRTLLKKQVEASVIVAEAKFRKHDFVILNLVVNCAGAQVVIVCLLLLLMMLVETGLSVNTALRGCGAG